jgi:HSP20 family protein
MFDEFGFFSPPKAYGSYGRATPWMSVRETDNTIEVEVELPGVDQKDVEVGLNEDVLTIKGQKRVQHEEDKKDYYYCQERTFGKFARSFTLPFEPDPKTVKSYFVNGILTITLPKPVGSSARMVKIPVKMLDS